MRIEPKPCPFCGGKPNLYEGEKNGFFHMCVIDGDAMVKIESRLFSSDEEAIEMWNRRSEPKRGRWEDIVELDSGGYPFKVGVWCSACGFETLSEDNYCPCCGAKMSEIPTDSESEDKE